MSLTDLEKIAHQMVAPGKGILAADESSGTIKKRFDAIDTESTETTRRDYREFMFRTPAMRDFISGVILYDETIWQNAADGTPLVKLIADAGAVPGIKVVYMSDRYGDAATDSVVPAVRIIKNQIDAHYYNTNKEAEQKADAVVTGLGY